MPINITSLTLTLTHSSLCHHTLAPTSTTPRNRHRATSTTPRNRHRATSITPVVRYRDLHHTAQPPSLQPCDTTTFTPSPAAGHRNLHHTAQPPSLQSCNPTPTASYQKSANSHDSTTFTLCPNRTKAKTC
ncbi:hypothetical protein VNO80_02005 [Phaseolus coccineus]|uniref:Uncharacterized protein n=1 Tax=Phaseolus coccineus TaxID=3886 RepID=A0AAN9WXW9_PHACN